MNGVPMQNKTISIPRGDTTRRAVDIEINGVLYEMKESDSLVLRVKKSLADKEPCLLKEVVGSNEFHFEPEDTENLHFGKYIYSVRLFTAEGDRYTVLNKETFEIAEVV